MAEKPVVEWKDFNKEKPTFSGWIWITDFKNIALIHWPEPLMYFSGKLWAKANVVYPDMPNKPHHKCYRGEFTSHILGNVLTLTYQEPEKDSVHIPISICPFCGFKPELP